MTIQLLQHKKIFYLSTITFNMYKKILSECFRIMRKGHTGKTKVRDVFSCSDSTTRLKHTRVTTIDERHQFIHFDL